VLPDSILEMQANNRTADAVAVVVDPTIVAALATSLRSAAKIFLDTLKEETTEIGQARRNGFGGFLSRRTYEVVVHGILVVLRGEYVCVAEESVE
jgi:hypothetical protein